MLAPDHRELFEAALAGAGQCAIIVRAKLRLVRAETQARVFLLFYDDLDAYLADQLALLRDGRFRYLEGQVVRRADDTGWRFMIEAARYFTPPRAPDEAALLAGLRDPPPRGADHHAELPRLHLPPRPDGRAAQVNRRLAAAASVDHAVPPGGGDGHIRLEVLSAPTLADTGRARLAEGDVRDRARDEAVDRRATEIMERLRCDWVEAWSRAWAEHVAAEQDEPEARPSRTTRAGRRTLSEQIGSARPAPAEPGSRGAKRTHGARRRGGSCGPSRCRRARW